jgi:hypothetical protein
VTPESRMEGVQHSRRTAAARSKTVVAADTTISNMEKEPARKLMLLAKVCANKEEAAGDDCKDLESKKGEDSEPKSQSHQKVGKLSYLRTTVGRVIRGQFYEYPRKVLRYWSLGV